MIPLHQFVWRTEFVQNALHLGGRCHLMFRAFPFDPIADLLDVDGTPERGKMLGGGGHPGQVFVQQLIDVLLHSPILPEDHAFGVGWNSPEYD